ncbi:endonuclease/exonuclease/phosphatase family protein [Sulfitobacter sp. TSTF-M16]|uniref:Endonuclease/exonuclease/phosphatase family protein n=1 Tax=Sulfitobacter aestuariivivens TaxID=2766981 RepID=A0A927D4A0_9RHOB|nr:endonuclease/exonuclease/phosphatase family protein [Sulfitobacter aestuariivivens]
MLRDILNGDDPQVRAVINTIVSASPDIITLQGIDYDFEGRALNALADALGKAGAPYPHRFAAPPNAGRMTDLDLDQNGKTGEARDAQGYGRFFGQGAMALLSRHPILAEDLQDFTPLLWRDLPNNLYPMKEGAPWGGAQAHAIQRLSSHGHWVVPIDHATFGPLHILTFHATPPVFDGPEDRNGRRNHDEAAFWSQFMDGAFGTAPESRFILMADANADPGRGESRSGAINGLLGDPRLHDPLPDIPTVVWDGPGEMRVDYVLPSVDWQVTDAAVLPADPVASRHRLVWVDLTR